MIEISKYSDLEIEVIFKNESGTEIPVPGYDFDLAFFVYTDRPVVASQRSLELTNCEVMEDNRLHLFFNAPNLGTGRLRARYSLNIPCEEFSDEFRRVVTEKTLDIKIFESAGAATAKPIVTEVIVAERDDYTDYLASEAKDYIITEGSNPEYFIKLNTRNGRN